MKDPALRAIVARTRATLGVVEDGVRSLRDRLPYDAGLGAFNAVEIVLDQDIVSDARAFYERHIPSRLGQEGGITSAEGHAFHVLHPVGWPSDIQWWSGDDEATFARFERLFDQVRPSIVAHRLLADSGRMYCAFFVTRTWCSSTALHVDYVTECGRNAYTLMTPLDDWEGEAGQLVYRDALGRLRTYRYKKGAAIVFGAGFHHGTLPCADAPRVFLCFTFGTSDPRAWRHIQRTVLGQSRLIRKPDGALIVQSYPGELLQEPGAMPAHGSYSPDPARLEATRSSVPKVKAVTAIAGKAVAQSLFNAAVLRLVREVVTILAEHQIPVMPLKGALLQRWIYGSRSFRPLSDVDLLVPSARFCDARSALSQAGFTVEREEPGGWEVAMRRPAGLLEIDLHHRLSSTVRSELTADDLFARGRLDTTLFDAEIVLPDPLDLYAHLLLHLTLEWLARGGLHHPEDLEAVPNALELQPLALARHLANVGLAVHAGLLLPYVSAATAGTFTPRLYESLSLEPSARLRVMAARVLCRRAIPGSLARRTAGVVLAPSWIEAGREALTKRFLSRVLVRGKKQAS